MKSINITEEALAAISDFNLPKDIGFGKVICPVMVTCKYENGAWGDLELSPYKKIELYPTSKVLHYAQEVFEGMKAYKTDGHEILLFRPDENEKRFASSSERMAIPVLPEGYFQEAVKTLVSYCGNFIPNGEGESLYIRPFVFATEESLGIRPSSSYLFIVIASPSGLYFQGDGLEVLIERKKVRAFPGGTGSAKTGGNYSGSLLSSVNALKLGYSQTLWLDALQNKFVEELSGMNFFAVIENTLYTPILEDTILGGITRKSIIEIAKNLNLQVIESKIDIDDLIEKIKSGLCTELFACGTAAVITSIAALGEEDGVRYFMKNKIGPWSIRLKNELVAIQTGQKKGPEGWSVKVSDNVIGDTSVEREVS